MAEASASETKAASAPPRVAGSYLHAGHVLGLAGFLLLPLTVLAPKGLGVLLPATALFGLLTYWLRHRRLPSLTAWPALLALSLIAWGIASAAWALKSGSSVSLAAQLAGDFLGGLIALSLAKSLDEGERRTVERGTVLGLLVGLCLFFLEWTTSGALSQAFDALTNSTGISYPTVLNRPATIVALCLWPAALVLWKRSPWLGLGVVVLCFVMLMQTESMSALLAMPAGILVFILTRQWPTHATKTVAAVLIAGIVAAPLLASYILPPLTKLEMDQSVLASIYHRVRIWQFAAHEIAAKPIAGWGLNASRHIGETGAKLRLEQEIDPTDPRYESMHLWLHGEEIDLMPLHPHNAALQLWLELGAVGAALGCALILLVTAAARRETDPDVKAAWLAQLTAGLFLASISFGVWQAWWQGALWLSTSIAFAIGHRRR